MRFLRSYFLVACCISLAVLTGCDKSLPVERAISLAAVHTSTPKPPPATKPVPHRLPLKVRIDRLPPAKRLAARKWIQHLALQAFFDKLWATRPIPSTRWGAPTPVSSQACPSGPVQDEIIEVFGVAAPWAQSIAVRESHCEPGAYNPSSASGIFQLLGHSDLLQAACPQVSSSISWSVSDCNIRAAYMLFEGSGIAPWRL